LLGSAKLRVDALDAGSTVDQIFTCLETHFPETPVQPQAIIKCRQEVGQSVGDYALVFQNLACKLGNLVSPELLRSLFVEGLAPAVRKSTKLLSDHKTLSEVIALAKTVESTEESTTPVYFLEQRVQQLEGQVRKRSADQISPCDRCGRNNHASSECKAHLRCFRCGKLGHKRNECKKKIGRYDSNVEFNNNNDNKNHNNNNNNNNNNNRNDSNRSNSNYSGMNGRHDYNNNRMGRVQILENPTSSNSIQPAVVVQPPLQPNMVMIPSTSMFSVAADAKLQPQQQLVLGNLNQNPAVSPIVLTANSLNSNPFYVAAPWAAASLPSSTLPIATTQVTSSSNASRASSVGDNHGTSVVNLLHEPYRQTESLLTVVMDVGESWQPFVVDTGCTTSVVSRKHLVGKPWKIMQVEPKRFSMANGMIETTTEILEMYFSEVDTHQIFYVLDLTVPFILGLDFFTKTKANIEFGQLALKIKDRIWKLIPSAGRTRDVWILEDKEMPEVLDIEIYPSVELNGGMDDYKSATLGVQSTEHKQQLLTLLESFAPIWRNQLPPNHECRLPAYKLELMDYTPFKVKPYRHSPTQQQEARHQVAKLLKARAIEPCLSAWCSPVVLITKKDLTTRFCIDFRKLNAVTIPDAGYLPRMETHLHQLAQGVIFSVIDMTSGYHQIRLHPDSRHLTAFAIDNTGELFHWRRLPFGLRNAPVAFMRRMSEILNMSFVKVYIDDIIVFSQSFHEHLVHLKEVLNVLARKRIILKPSKCALACTSVNYLGHEVSANGIRPTVEKLNVLNSLPSPTSKGELKSLMGLFSFYRRFIPNYSRRVNNMQTTLSATAKFTWSDTCEKERKDIVTALSQMTLSHPHPDWQYIVYSDASSVAIGGALHQCDPQSGRLYPLGFYSRALTSTEQRYPICELEALAVVFIVERCTELLMGKHFIVYTDNSNLCHVFNATNTGKSNRVLRYVLRLSEFHFDIRLITTAKNVVADYLSRFHAVSPEEDRSLVITSSVNVVTRSQVRQQQQTTSPEMEVEVKQLESVSEPRLIEVRQQEVESKNLPTSAQSLEDIPKNDLKYHQQQDEFVKRLEVASNSPQFVKPFVKEEGLWYFLDKKQTPLAQKRIIIPASLIPWAMSLFHDHKLAGHNGSKAMLAKMNSHLWIRGLPSKITRYVKSCHECQMRQTGRRYAPVIQPLYSNRPMQRIHIDLVGPLPLSQQQERWLLVIKDAFSGFIVLRPLLNKTAEAVVLQLIAFMGSFGIPISILSDNGREFRNKLNDELVRVLGIKRLYTTAYHPAANGSVERVNRVIHNLMSIYLRQSHKSTHYMWTSILPFVEYSLNTTINRSSGFTPFQMLFGHQPNLPGFTEEYPLIDEQNHMRHSLSEFKRIWELALQQKQSLAAEMVANQRVVTEHSFQPGDLAKLFAFIRPSLEQHSKWLAKWIGPFQILKVVGKANVVVTDGKRKQTVNASRLRPYHQRSNEEISNFPTLPDFVHSNNLANTDEEFEMDRIVAHRETSHGREYLVKWTDYSDAHNSWEPAIHLSKKSVDDYHRVAGLILVGTETQ